MPTRRQDPENAEFRQSAFASSAEHERGILGNLVAARCHKLTDRDEIAMVWWLQQVSWREGGMEKFAADFVADNRTQIGTPSMIKLGMAPGRIYSAAEVRAVRNELNEKAGFLLKGERDRNLVLQGEFCDDADALYEADERSENYPETYPASAFADACAIDPRGFADALKRALVDPSAPSLRRALWNFPALWEALNTCRLREIQEASERIVATAITRQIADELDFSLETRSFVLIEGREGIGKSEGALSWCDQRPGRAIYVRLEAGSDETTLYRSIARRIGTACSYQRKAVEMRARIQDALQNGHMMLVLDEAHFLWPQGGRSERGVPKRMDWIRTALVDFGVPVALISTPQYFATQCERFRKAGWNANQVQRRLARTVQLPEMVSTEDALAVGKSYFPDCPPRLLKRAAGVALLSVARLTMFKHLRKRVDFLGSRRAGATHADLLEIALAEISAPGGDGAPAAPIAAPVQRARSVPAADFSQPDCEPTNRLRVAAQHLEVTP